MAVYIKTPDGLKRISNEDIEAKDIEKALGYTPSDFSGNYQDLNNAPDIFDDASGVLVIADTSGNIIVKIDNDGIHTTDVDLNGISVKHKLENMDSLTDDSDTLYVSDGDGNVIAKIDKDGVHTTQLNAFEVFLDGEPLSEKLKNILSSITEDDTGTLYIADESGNVIAKIDGNGFQTTTVKAKQVIADEIFLGEESLEEKLKAIEESAGSSDFSGSWNDLTDKPTLFDGDYDSLTNKPIENETDDDSDDRLIIADESGNVVATIDRNGINTVAFYEKGKKVINDFGSNEETADGFKKYYFLDMDVEINGGTYNLNIASTNTALGLPEDAILPLRTYIICNDFTVFEISRADGGRYSLSRLINPKGVSVQVLRQKITVDANNIWAYDLSYDVGLFLIDTELNIYKITKRTYDTSLLKYKHTLEKYAGLSGSSGGGNNNVIDYLITEDTTFDFSSSNIPLENGRYRFYNNSIAGVYILSFRINSQSPAVEIPVYQKGTFVDINASIGTLFTRLYLYVQGYYSKVRYAYGDYMLMPLGESSATTDLLQGVGVAVEFSSDGKSIRFFNTYEDAVPFYRHNIQIAYSGGTSSISLCFTIYNYTSTAYTNQDDALNALIGVNGDYANVGGGVTISNNAYPISNLRRDYTGSNIVDYIEDKTNKSITLSTIPFLMIFDNVKEV